MKTYARKRVRPFARGVKMSLLVKLSYLVSGRTRTGLGIQTRAPEYPGGENRRKLSIQMVSKESDLKKARGSWKFVPTKNFRPRRILAPTGLDEASAVALDYASALARRFGSELALLYAFEGSDYAPHGTQRQQRRHGPQPMKC